MVKDFDELNLNDIREEYLNDSDEVLCLTVVVDHSNSMGVAKAMIEMIPAIIKKILEKNPEAVAKVRVCIITYGTKIEQVCDFVSVRDIPERNEYTPMGNTSTSIALNKAFDVTKAEMRKWGAYPINKKVKPGIVIHVTDGVPVEEDAVEKIENVIKKYDSYTNLQGDRKIKIISIGTNEKACKILEYYSDSTYVSDDYEGIEDAITNISDIVSCLSSVSSNVDTTTGEVYEEIPEQIVIPSPGEGVLEIKERKKSMFPFKSIFGKKFDD